MLNIGKHLRIIFFALVVVLVSSAQVTLNACEGATASSSGSTSISPELEVKLKSLQINDTILVWIDVQAWVDRFGDRYLPADPMLYGINWILISYDPDIEQNNLFWVLAEVKAGTVRGVSEISWVKNITLIKVGEHERLFENPKFAVEGIDYAIQRATNEGNKSLHVISYVENQTISMRRELNPPSNSNDVILANVTSLISQLGGEVLRVGSYKNKLLARIPSRVIEKVTENSYVSEIYLQGPIVFEGEPLMEKQSLIYVSYRYANDLAIKLGYSVILGLILDFAIAVKKLRRRRLTLYVIAILSAASVLVLLPSVKALDVSTEAILATDVWDDGNRGQGVTVAVVDSGIDFNHQDFPLEAIKASWNFPDNNATPAQDTDGHGTRVAGIIAGRGIINSAYRGVAWGSSLVVVRITSAFDLDDAISWVMDRKYVYDIRVLNLCWAAPGFPAGEDGSSVYSKAVDDAIEMGIVVVKSAGNMGQDLKTITTPGDAFNVITVGAIDDMNTPNISDDMLWEHSSRGPTGDERPKPDVIAPGVRVISTNLAGGYAERNGTSYSAPHVSGAVALMLQANPDLTPAQVKAILRQTARLNDNLAQLTVNDRGHGIIDAYAAVQLAQNVNSIQTSQMYDSWEVTTPARHFDGIGKCWDYLTFAVAPPSSTFGITFKHVVYHWRDWWGAQAIDYELIYRLSAQHVWIDGTYYHFGDDMHKYLLSGPRIYYKADYGAVFMRAWFKVGNTRITYDWFMGVDRVKTSLYFSGGSQWKTLMYIDTDVWDYTNYPYLPSTDETILIETKITGDVNLTIRDLDHTEHVQLDPSLGGSPTMWVLRHGYYGNNPDADTVKNDEYMYNRDIAIFYQETSQNPSITVHRKTDSLPSPNPNQNDAGTGEDAGNSFDTATSISSGSYEGILCSSDPTDTDDWYQFYAESGKIISLSMTPPYDIDFDLELYDPYGDLKGWSYNGPGYSDGIAYTADLSGNWRARIYISSGEAQYSFSVSVYSGGGCPFVYVWNGTHYVIDNNLLAASAWSNGEEVGDYYKLEQNLVPSYEGDYYSLYSLRLSEFQNEHSYLDQAQLITVDHNSDINVAVSPFGEILTYQNPYAPFSAVDDQGHDQIELIQDIDDVYYEGYNGSYLLLNFSLVEGEIAKLVMRADRPPLKESIHIQVLDSTGNWMDIVSIIPRTYWATEIIDLSSYLSNSTEEFKVRLYFTDNHKVDFLGLDTTTQAQINVEEDQLLLAYHSDDGVVTTKLQTDDDVYAELTPGQQITLLFAATTQNAEQRTFIIYVKGYYTILDN